MQQLVSIYSKQVYSVINFIANPEFYLLSFLWVFSVIKFNSIFAQFLPVITRKCDLYVKNVIVIIFRAMNVSRD